MSKNKEFDAIVVGSGLSGGYAAKVLCEKGLKVLMVERGPEHKHIESYTNALKEPWELPHRGRLTPEIKKKFPIMTLEGGYPINETNDQFWMPFEHSPYQRPVPYDWYRGFGTGGKSLTWGRQVYRWSDLDFEANAKENIAIDWPIRYKDIEPFYTKVEKFIGVSGQKLGLKHLPDSHFQPPMQLNCVEKDFAKKLKTQYKSNRVATIGRVAHLTQPTEEQKNLGRSSCQYRNACAKGCPYGAYFSSNSASIPAAELTNNLSMLSDFVVTEIVYDSTTSKASGIKGIDTTTMEEIEYQAKIIFLNASTIGSTHILLNSKSSQFSEGLGNTNGVLGTHLMDHHSRVGASGTIEGYRDSYYYGRRANGMFIPRYRNLGSDKRDYLRGFDYQGGAYRKRMSSNQSFGKDFKENYSKLGEWSLGFGGFGECLPYENNTIKLDSSKKDQFGMAQLVFNASFKENETKMRIDMKNDAAEMLERFGAKNIKSYAKDNPPLGLSKHEMGTARMGNDPKTSILNKHNQVWDCKNVFVTDGACMTSSSMVNPSLTYLALTHRAAEFAVDELNKKNL